MTSSCLSFPVIVLALGAHDKDVRRGPHDSPPVSGDTEAKADLIRAPCNDPGLSP